VLLHLHEMSFLTSLFRRRQPEDFESVLTRLKTDIERRQTRISELRLRERRATLLITLWTLAFWAVYSTAWYTTPILIPFVVGRVRGDGLDKAVKGAPVVLGPIVILFARRIMQLWYARTSVKEENILQNLRKEQRQKIEEFKKQTKYYETRNLLEKFDEAPPNSPRRPGTPQGNGSAPQTPKRPLIQTPARTPAKTPLPPHLAVSPARPQTPPRKQWYDKVADAILGDEEGGGIGSSNRYALICQKCFAHNGLVKESVWEDTQYVCPKCGQFNPSARSLREGTTVPPTPASAVQMSIGRTPNTPWSPTHITLPHPTTGTPVAANMRQSKSAAPGPPPNLDVPRSETVRRRKTEQLPTVNSDSEEEEGYTMDVDS